VSGEKWRAAVRGSTIDTNVTPDAKLTRARLAQFLQSKHCRTVRYRPRPFIYTTISKRPGFRNRRREKTVAAQTLVGRCLTRYPHS